MMCLQGRYLAHQLTLYNFFPHRWGPFALPQLVFARLRSFREAEKTNDMMRSSNHCRCIDGLCRQTIRSRRGGQGQVPVRCLVRRGQGQR